MTTFISILSTVFLLLLTNCSSQPKHADGTQFDQSNFENVISSHTQQARKYQGLYNTFDIRVTFLNSLVGDTLLQKKKQYFQWDPSEYRKHREQMFQEQSSSSKALLAFYTPERKDNDLDKAKTIWKVYLVHKGQKYLGTIKKLKINRSEFVRLFPHFTRWDTPYEVTFKIPMSIIEQKDNTIIVTSSLGSSNFKFQPLKQ